MQIFDLWLGQFEQSFSENSSAACEPDGRGLRTLDWCAKWTFHKASTGKVNGKSLSGSLLFTNNVPTEERYVTVSWTCSGRDVYHGVIIALKGFQGTYSSAGTVDLQKIQIRASSAAQAGYAAQLSDADRANGITWKGGVLITYIYRTQLSTANFAGIGDISKMEWSLYDRNLQERPPAAGPWSSYTDVTQSVDGLTVKNGNLVFPEGGSAQLSLGRTTVGGSPNQWCLLSLPGQTP